MGTTRRRKHVIGTCYLLHFDEPFKHAKHYLGWTEEADVTARLAAHAAGHGANLIRVINEAGHTWRLARTWVAVTRFEERRLKNGGGRSRYCPICTPGAGNRDPRAGFLAGRPVIPAVDNPTLGQVADL